MRETQQLFPVTNGFAKVTTSTAELPLRALHAYKALLIELAKRDLLNKAQNAHILLKPRVGLEREQCLSGTAFLDVVRQLSSVGLECSFDVEPPGIIFTSLVESYSLTHLEDVAANWQAKITLPSELLEHLIFEVLQQRDWIGQYMFPITACEDTANAGWTENLTIRCVPRQA